MRTFTVAIPTYNRELDLGACLESIAAQSRPPNEVLLIDDASLPNEFVARWKERFLSLGVALAYYRKDHAVERRGSSESRNVALRVASGEIVFFFDDDVVLEDGFLAGIMAVWESAQADDPKLLGVGGLIRNSRAKDGFERVYNALFGLTSPHSWDVNDVTYTVWDEGIPEPARGYYMHGGVSSVRRKEAAAIGFSTFTGGRAALEDLDFCLAAKKRGHHFILVPGAKVVHNHSPAAREDEFLIGVKESVHRLEIYRKSGLKTWRGRLWFVWATVGWILRLARGLHFSAMAGKIYGFFVRDPQPLSPRAPVPIEVACLSFDSNMFGSERSMLDVLSRLDRTKAAPSVILVRPGPLAGAAAELQIPVHNFPWLAGPFPAYDPRTTLAAIRLSRWLRAHKIRVVELNRLSFGHLAVVAVAARLAGARTITRVRMFGEPISLFQKMTLLLSDLIIPVSESAVEPWRRGWRLRGLSRRLRVIHDSRNVAALKRLERDRALLRALGIPGGARVVGMVGAVVRNKRQDLFLRAAELIRREIPDVWFMIVGGELDETSRAYVEGLTEFLAGKPLAQRTVYTGYREDALRLMKNFDVLIVPSDREAFGGVVIEAMALGVPVVAHRVDGMVEALNHGACGVLIEKQEPADYAAAVVRLLREPEEAARLRAEAGRFVERFESAMIARETENIYAELARR